MEFIKFEKSEENYLMKQMLYSEMELLRIKKNIENYKNLKKRENLAKSTLKRNFLLIKNTIKAFDKLVPDSKFASTEEVKKKETSKKTKKRSDLESEIEEIKLKIQRLSI